jgi:hypothetical protein
MHWYVLRNRRIIHLLKRRLQDSLVGATVLAEGNYFVNLTKLAHLLAAKREFLFFYRTQSLRLL